MGDPEVDLASQEDPADEATPPEPGLWLVATPIGNLGDVSQRALAVLRGVEVIACEDTRHSGRLLARHGITTRRIACHEHNEAIAVPGLIALLSKGRSVAYVSDAGTPGLADPGFRLVRAALAAGCPVRMVPGPNAALMAVVLSGLPCHSFTFRGFPPRKEGARRRWLAVDQTSPHTQVIYEAKWRLAATLTDCLAVYGDRPAALAGDLTKRFEEVRRGTLAHLLAEVEAGTPRGEFVLVIAGHPGGPAAEDPA